jgi:hypothetical protein
MLRNNLVFADAFLYLADFESYSECQKKVDPTFRSKVLRLLSIGRGAKAVCQSSGLGGFPRMVNGPNCAKSFLRPH